MDLAEIWREETSKLGQTSFAVAFRHTFDAHHNMRFVDGLQIVGYTLFEGISWKTSLRNPVDVLCVLYFLPLPLSGFASCFLRLSCPQTMKCPNVLMCFVARVPLRSLGRRERTDCTSPWMFPRLMPLL